MNSDPQQAQVSQAEHECLAAEAQPTFHDLLLSTRRLADTYAFLTERLTRFAAGKLAADDLVLIFQHQIRAYQDDAVIQAIYEHALRDFTRTQGAPTES
jgi:hypothetical protein